MSSFTSDLQITHLGKKSEFPGKWRLENDLVFLSTVTGEVVRIVIEKGFVTDGGSFPNALVPSIGSQTGDYFESYVIHDGLARRKDLVTWGESNAVLYEALGVQGMSWYRRRKVAFGLLFGSPSKKEALLLNADKYVTMDRIGPLSMLGELLKEG